MYRTSLAERKAATQNDPHLFRVASRTRRGAGAAAAGTAGSVYCSEKAEPAPSVQLCCAVKKSSGESALEGLLSSGWTLGTTEGSFSAVPKPIFCLGPTTASFEAASQLLRTRFNYPFWFKGLMHGHDVPSVRRGYEVYRQVLEIR